MRRRDFLWLTLGGSAYASLAGASALQQSLLDALGTQLPARTLDGAATTIPSIRANKVFMSVMPPQSAYPKK